MGTSKGNRKYIETPERLYKLFEEFKKFAKNKPVLKMEFKGKEAEKVYYELERPLTLEGFENYLADRNIIQSLGEYFANTNGNYDDYSNICKRIKREIRDDQIVGGMTGIYNTSITQRLNNLVEKQETSLKVENDIFKAIDLDVPNNDSTEEDS